MVVVTVLVILGASEYIIDPPIHYLQRKHQLLQARSHDGRGP
jgi:hypothetical protein